jgi:hypothetical protein
MPGPDGGMPGPDGGMLGPDDVTCLSEKSEAACTFPLLTAYVRRCGQFPGLAAWEDVAKGFPHARLSAQLCRLPDVASAPASLRDYIIRANITGIVIFGDSQAMRSAWAFFQLIKDAGFQCKEEKKELPGQGIGLQPYYGSAVANDTLQRTCSVCNSELQRCVRGQQHVHVEYLSMDMTSTTPLNCSRGSSVCQPTTHQQYLLQHYLHTRGQYPQLILYLSTYGHDRMRPLAECYDGTRSLYHLLTRHVPSTTTIIWYNCPAWHSQMHSHWYTSEGPLHTLWYTSEGPGFSPNDKLQVQNAFLARLLQQHHATNSSVPRIFSFFDLYHLDEQLRGEWAEDKIHYEHHWYSYIMRYTATLLPSLPML